MLACYLTQLGHTLTGIDPDYACIWQARQTNNCVEQAHFICDDFLSHQFTSQYDAVIFVASLHHMDMYQALAKAKTLLRPNGSLIVIGLARPSSVWDWIVEGLRVLPSAIISHAHQFQSCKNHDVPESYTFPTLQEVKRCANKLLPHYSMRRAFALSL